MNRIVLIGNGFDLAHGMNTSYSHFIANYWHEIGIKLKSFYNSNFTSSRKTFDCYGLLVRDMPGPHISKPIDFGLTYLDIHRSLESIGLELIFTNKFLEILNQKNNLENWVDIENEYYRLLKENLKNEKHDDKIKCLNNDFIQVKLLLEAYLRKIENEFTSDLPEKQIIGTIGHKIYAPFNIKDFSEDFINKKAELEFEKYQKIIQIESGDVKDYSIFSDKEKSLLNKLTNPTSVKEIRRLLISDGASIYFDLLPNELLFLNFNYTATEKFYDNQYNFGDFESKKSLKKQIIHIHGAINKDDINSIIFGYGDELDEDYKTIENLNNNAFLENIKSIKYLDSKNYKNLLEFIESDDYQIFIFGHSCGMSDRTLLNTLFEHKNCVSIKPFYHKIDDENDNFIDIISHSLKSHYFKFRLK